MHDLNIDIICANTAAAKGRVERAHFTRQDQADISTCGDNGTALGAKIRPPRAADALRRMQPALFRGGSVRGRSL
jgi:hypothetical protein